MLGRARAAATAYPGSVRYLQIGLGHRSPDRPPVSTDLADLTRCALVLSRPVRGATSPVFTDLASALRQTDPDFVLCLSRARQAPGLITQCVEAGRPVLTEAPPATDAAGLARLTALVDSGLVQVGQPYLHLPDQAAGLAVVGAGLIGRVNQVQICGPPAHGAIALIRAYLSAPGPAAGPVAGLTVADFGPADGAPGPATRVVTLEFDAGLTGLYITIDRTNRAGRRADPERADSGRADAAATAQPWPRLIRGSTGQIAGAVWTDLSDAATVATTRFQRSTTAGSGSTLNDIRLGDTVVWRNPRPRPGWSDVDIARGTILTEMMSFTRGDGPGPYRLADALEDLRVSLAIDQASA